MSTGNHDPIVFLQLESSDNKILEISQEAIKQSKVLSDFADMGSTDAIPVPNVLGSHLQLIVEWCEHHKEEPFPEKSVKDLVLPRWDKEFFGKIDNYDLFFVLQASNALDVRGLLNMACQTVANMLKGKSPEEMRAVFYTPYFRKDETTKKAEIERELAELDVNGAGPSNAGNDRSTSIDGPSDSGSGSSNSGAGPSDSGAGPSDSEAGPSYSGAGPSTSGSP